MARYNAWANQRLYAACAALPPQDYHAARPSFFGSIHATLNHILVADSIWMGRFTGNPPPGVTRLDQILHADFTSLQAARMAKDAEIIAFCDALTETDIAELGTTQIRALTTTQVAVLSTAQIDALDSTAIASLNTTQIRALTTSQIAALDETQVGALSTTAVAALAATQIAALSTTALNALSTAQTQALTPEQVVALTSAGASSGRAAMARKRRSLRWTPSAPSCAASAGSALSRMRAPWACAMAIASRASA